MWNELIRRFSRTKFSIFFLCSLVKRGRVALFSLSRLKKNNSSKKSRLFFLADQPLNTPDWHSHLTLLLLLCVYLPCSSSNSSCCFSHQASGSSQVFDQCSVAGRLVVVSSVRQRQRASSIGMKGNGAVQPLIFTMGNLLSEAVGQITTFSLPFL